MGIYVTTHTYYFKYEILVEFVVLTNLTPKEIDNLIFSSASEKIKAEIQFQKGEIDMIVIHLVENDPHVFQHLDTIYYGIPLKLHIGRVPLLPCVGMLGWYLLQDRIEVRVVRPSDIVGGEGPGPLLTALTEDDVEDFDFCMANPPFFASEDEVR